MIDTFKLSDYARNFPIEGLHIPVPIYNKLKTGRIKSFEQLLTTVGTGGKLLNTAQKERVRATIRSFQSSLDAHGDPNWSTFCENEGITIIPQSVSLNSDAETLSDLSRTIEEILTFGDSSPKKWSTIQYRFGLNGKTLMTLDEIGQALGKITREAVRLIERKSLIELNNALLQGNFVGKQYRVNERISGFVGSLQELIASSGLDYATESELFAVIGDSVGSRVQHRAEPLLRLVFSLFGLSQIRELPEALPRVWKTEAKYPEAKLQRALTLVATTLTGDYSPPLDEFELLAKVNRKMRSDQAISAEELSRILGLCDFVETTNDGQIQAKFEHIGSRVGQAERLLVEAGKPLSINELVREMNRRLHAAGQSKLELLNVANVMSSDRRFVAIGSSGLRGLARWENVESRSIVDVMEDALVSINRPANADEVFAYVKERRPASLNSVKIYLDTQERFLRTGPKEWGLTTWAEARRLNGEFEKTRRRNAPPQRLKETQFERSVKIIRERLEQDPKHQVPLSVLVSELEKQLALRDKTAYQYIDRMEFIKKIKKGPKEMVCVLIEE